MGDLLELQDLYNEALVREIIEKTKAVGLTWEHLGGTQFKATEGSFDFYVTKTQIGNLSYRYNLDVKKDSITAVTIIDGPLPATDRESQVKELYEIIEIIVLELDKKLKEALQFVQDLEDARG